MFNFAQTHTLIYVNIRLYIPYSNKYMEEHVCKILSTTAILTQNMCPLENANLLFLHCAKFTRTCANSNKPTHLFFMSVKDPIGNLIYGVAGIKCIVGNDCWVGLLEREVGKYHTWFLIMKII